MILLNFTHPITAIQLTQLTALLDRAPTQIINVKTRFDEQQPFIKQVKAMVEYEYAKLVKYTTAGYPEIGKYRIWS